MRHDPGIEVTANQTEHPTIRNTTRQSRHQNVVVDAIKELLQIDIHHHSIPRLYVALRSPNRIMRTTPRTEAEARLRERRIDQRLQHLQQRLS